MLKSAAKTVVREIVATAPLASPKAILRPVPEGSEDSEDQGPVCFSEGCFDLEEKYFDDFRESVELIAGKYASGINWAEGDAPDCFPEGCFDIYHLMESELSPEDAEFEVGMAVVELEGVAKEYGYEVSWYENDEPFCTPEGCFDAVKKLEDL